MLDLILKNGTVIDGTGAARTRADVAVAADRIEVVGDASQLEAKEIIDVTGKIIAPGFVDVHNHTDAWLLKTPHLTAKTMQGFTTEVIMSDGISYAPVSKETVSEWIYYLRSLNGLLPEEYTGWETIAEYMACMDRRNVQNAIAQIPYANVRSIPCGFGSRRPDDDQMARITAIVQESMEQGAVGMSTGLDYIAQCFSTTDELVEACRPMAPFGGIYATHLRYKKGILPALREAVEIGQRAQIPVHISHMKTGDAATNDLVLEYVDKTARNEVDFSFDVYPYLPGSTMLTISLPHAVWEDGPLGVIPRLRDPKIRRAFELNIGIRDLSSLQIAWLPSVEHADYIGKPLGQYVADSGQSLGDALCDLLISEGLAVLLVFMHGDDAITHPLLSHDCYMMGSDGIFMPSKSTIHPRVYGSAPRLLGPCVRDHQLFSLEQAVRKLSGYPAERFGLSHRGRVAEGYFADLVVFDADTVQDRATYQDPHQYPSGMEHTFVNGVGVIRDGAPVKDLPEQLPGRALRFKE